MATKKKKKSDSAGPMSDKAYVQSGNARKLPIYKCLVNGEWKESGIAQVVVTRAHVTGNITGAVYLVDLLCTGVKDSFFFFNQPADTLTELAEGFLSEEGVQMENCDYELAHNIVYSGLEFADEYGIEPINNFVTTRMILQEDTEDIPLIDIECGKNGKPFLVAGSMDLRTRYYLQQLKKNAGEGNYEFVLPVGEGADDDEEGDDDDLFSEGLEQWTREDWEDFIENADPEDLEAYEEIPVYIYQKSIQGPQAAARRLDIDAWMEKCTRGISYDPVTDREYGNDPQENEEAEAIHYIIMGEKPAARTLKALIPRIGEAMQRWPGSPIFHNHLYNTYILLKQEREADAVLQRLTETFPDYLFGKVAYAHKLMKQERLDEVPGVFNDHPDLSSLYPERQSFHISEFVSFMTVFCLYFIQTDDPLMAGLYGSLLKEWVTDPVPVQASGTFLLLDTYLLTKVVAKLAEANADPVKRDELITLLIS